LFVRLFVPEESDQQYRRYYDESQSNVRNHSYDVIQRIKVQPVDGGMINIGGIDDRPETVMGMINSVFAKGMDDRQRAERLSEVYNIPDAEYIFDRMRGLSMTIDEEMHRGWKREGVDEALESGEVVSKEQYIEQRITDCIFSVNNLMKDGISLEKAIDLYVPPDIRDDVRERLTPKLEQ